jgi:hypothetical protein
MTAKDKAKELVSKFNFEHTGQSYILHQTVDESKRCALIAVDEMINWKETLFVTEGSMAYQYLLKVKQEIENL